MNTPTKITVSRIIAIGLMIVGLITLDIIDAVKGTVLAPLNHIGLGITHINLFFDGFWCFIITKR